MVEQTLAVPPSASHHSTNQVVFDLLDPLLRPSMKILDFGAGRGHMAARLANRLVQIGADPQDCIVACDLDTEGFAISSLDCANITWTNSLPWPDNQFDAAYSIEVIEHLENPYAFAREMLRVVKPGGKLVLTTPNIHHMTSRWSYLLRGYPTMFGIVTFKPGDEGHGLGHVAPIFWTSLYSALHRAGASRIRLHVDRRKKSAIFLTVFALPWVAAAVWAYRRWLANGSAANRSAEKEFGNCIQQMASFDILTSRSLVVEIIKSES